ncbi:glycosyltransferase family 9 protein [Xenorhabdus khoisanae]|uniref:glycosyltransferase family 9 protein n=1 Tax=Xenorhabdus khoisanae TaxID=880157 RepID=UPI0032B86CDC
MFPCISLKNIIQVTEHCFPLILFSVSNNRKSSLISNDRLALIAHKISDHYPEAKFIISSLNNDVLLAEDLKARIGESSEIVISDSLSSFLTLLNNMSLIIVGNGGICHLSAALQKNLVALYAVTKPENWAPLASNDKCVTLYDPENVNSIDLDKIYSAIFFLLEKQK